LRLHSWLAKLTIRRAFLATTSGISSPDYSLLPGQTHMIIPAKTPDPTREPVNWHALSAGPFHDALGLAKLIYFGWAASGASTTKPVSLTLTALAEAIAAMGGDQGQRAPSRENRKAQQFAPVLELRRNG
jgi:hypothetical protein